MTPLAFLLIAALAAAPARAEIREQRITLDPVFGSHAVLQRGKPVQLWGDATPGESLTVRFHGQAVGCVADRLGRWRAVLAPMEASQDAEDLVVSGHETVVKRDIVVGDVWFCSGQSNMEFTVEEGMDADREIAAANFPMIRQVVIDHEVAASPAAVARADEWKAATPDAVGQFSGAAFYFARSVYQAMHVPIGIVRCAWGGTPIEAWMSREARAATPYAGAIDERWRTAVAGWTPERAAKYRAALKVWQDGLAKAEETHTDNTAPWPAFPADDTSPERPGTLYNAMVAPLRGLALSGFLWYQGESNVGHPEEYAVLFESLIRSWRRAWGEHELPFYYVQLASFGDVNERKDRSWARLREAQAKALEIPGTGMATAVDIGDPVRVHPKNKQEVGRRLALLAKAKYYRLSAKSSGPVFLQASREGDSFRVSFGGIDGELSSRGGPVADLEVAGPDHVFHPAQGEPDVYSLIVWSPDVPDPRAVRYAWTNAPKPNLYDSSGLPVLPFRSDDW